MKAINNELEHKDCQPPQGMWHFYTGGKKLCVDLATHV